MRKAITLLIALFIVIGGCFGAKNIPTEYLKQINIQGGYDTVASIKIVPISAPLQQWQSGMPFPINDSSVLGGNKRQIASWSILANKQFVLNIAAELLHNYQEDNTSSPSYSKGLGYILEFVYDISYYTNTAQNNKTDASFSIHVEPKTNQKYDVFQNIDLLEGITIDGSSLVGGADGKIFFSFDPVSSTLLTDTYNAYPNGNYTARVVIELAVK